MAELIISVRPYERRVALTENGTVTELYVEWASEQGLLSNIYKGRVVRVLPGMEAAFVDIGLDKAAFLHVSDVYEEFKELETLLKVTEKDEVNKILPNSITAPLIEDLIHKGQEILVQVSKEPMGKKGARITSYISIPGRYLVLLPRVNQVGVSRRIESETERKRLRDMVLTVKPQNCGFIVRTASEGVDEDKIRTEMDFLLRLWNNIETKKASAAVPSLVYRELDTTLRAVRDLFTREVNRLIIDSKDEYQKILEFVDTFMPELKGCIELYEGNEPLFDSYGIEIELNRVLGKKVWLKSGGYIVIERTEGLTAIDVNTGRYVGRRNVEETILKTNLEAAKEIAYQLRLRNIGGIIVIDFIDMEKMADREKVLNALKEALKKDKSQSNVLYMSELGLVEMTRKRTKESLSEILSEPCFYCDGVGLLKSKKTLCYEIFRAVENRAPETIGDSIILNVHPDIASLLYDEERHFVDELENRVKKQIIIRSHKDYHLEEYTIHAL